MKTEKHFTRIVISLPKTNSTVFAWLLHTYTAYNILCQITNKFRKNERKKAYGLSCPFFPRHCEHKCLATLGIKGFLDDCFLKFCFLFLCSKSAQVQKESIVSRSCQNSHLVMDLTCLACTLSLVELHSMGLVEFCSHRNDKCTFWPPRLLLFMLFHWT